MNEICFSSENGQSVFTELPRHVDVISEIYLQMKIENDDFRESRS